jgi:uncharacterized RDD family membrane protein YckC
MSKEIIDSSLESSGEKQVYASSWRRLIAYILDFILASWILYVLYIISFIIIIGFLPIPLVTLYDNINNIISFGLIPYTVYFGLSFLIFGNTLGGKAAGINVVNTAGGIISKRKLAFRGLIIGVLTSLSLSISPSLILLVSMTSLFDKKKKTLYDIVFGTVVTKDKIL